MYFLTLQHSKANQIIVCINLRKLILFIFFILHNVRGNRILLFCNFDNCLSRKMVVVCNDFQRKQKLKKFIILNSYEKMDVCILRHYANVQSEITLVSWHDDLPTSQFDSYIYTLNMKQGPEVSRHESELNTNCQTLVDRSFTTLYRSGRAWSLHSSLDAV